MVGDGLIEARGHGVSMIGGGLLGAWGHGVSMICGGLLLVATAAVIGT